MGKPYIRFKHIEDISLVEILSLLAKFTVGDFLVITKP